MGTRSRGHDAALPSRGDGPACGHPGGFNYARARRQLACRAQGHLCGRTQNSMDRVVCILCKYRGRACRLNARAATTAQVLTCAPGGRTTHRGPDHPASVQTSPTAPSLKSHLPNPTLKAFHGPALPSQLSSAPSHCPARAALVPRHHLRPCDHPGVSVSPAAVTRHRRRWLVNSTDFSQAGGWMSKVKAPADSASGEDPRPGSQPASPEYPHMRMGRGAPGLPSHKVTDLSTGPNPQGLTTRRGPV